MLICDKDAFVSVSGATKKEYLERKVSSELEKIMSDRKTVLLNKSNNSVIPLHNDDEETSYNSQVIAPIIAEGDEIGAVIILSKEDDVELGDVETKLVETAAAFLGKQMEQ